MKKVVAILLVLVVCFGCLAGCEAAKPSRKRIVQDVTEELYTIIAKKEAFRDIEFGKIILADREDDRYWAQIEVSYVYYSDVSYDAKLLTYKDVYMATYKHYDTGGWVLVDVTRHDSKLIDVEFLN